VIHNGQLAGVLTVYAAVSDAFSEDHERVLEAVSTQIAAALFNSSNAARIPSASPPISARGPNQYRVNTADAQSSICVAILKIHRQSAMGPALEVIANFVRQRLRPSDLVFRRGEELILLLHVADRSAANLLVDSAIDHVRARLNDAVGLSSTAVYEPRDIADLEHIFATEDRIDSSKPPSSIH